MAELIAIHAGLHLLHALKLRGTVYSNCLGAVKKIARRWTPGSAFQTIGAVFVSANWAYLSDKVSVQWIKGHPELIARTPLPLPGHDNTWRTSVPSRTHPCIFFESTQYRSGISCPWPPRLVSGNGQIMQARRRWEIYAPP